MYMKKTTNEIRNMFLEFFVQKKHQIIPGSSLIPHNDSTLLFTNAGMNQFKNIFLGNVDVDPFKIVTTQNCLRTGGKHNDLENIGNTPHHHTFFEMLGNFSFKSYFKKESILYAWELLTSPRWFHLSKKKLLVTVHSHDKETFDIWKNVIKIPTTAIVPIGSSNSFEEDCDNFWQMGKTGPCGPSTEIFFQNNNCAIPKLITSKILHDNYVEIWNIVFLQFNKILNGSLIPLSNLSVDTGMGLERIASILQKKSSNYEIDFFQKLMQKILNLSNVISPDIKSLRIIADHIRSSSFIIAENIIPSNEGRGYILRKLIRRAMRCGFKLKIKTPFLYKLVPELTQFIHNNNAIITKTQEKIEKIIKLEEEKFSNTLYEGLKQLSILIKKNKNNLINGDNVFYLYDTFGFPIELTTDVCKEKNVQLDLAGFTKKMQQQKKSSISQNNFITNYNDYFISHDSSIFKGYECIETSGIVISIYKNQKIVNVLSTGEKGVIILDKTTFYGESGGQVGDTGVLYNNTVVFKVINTKKYTNTIIHEGTLIKGNIYVKDVLTSKIDWNKRLSIQANHTATHLLNASLKTVLGNHIYQKGSFLNHKYLRFDFFHTQTIPSKTIVEIETLVNEYIQKNILIKTKEISLIEARKKGIHGLFNAKYNNNVRVVKVKNFSYELCGGTHAIRTGDLGIFKIDLKVNKISSDTYRLNATTKMSALNIIQKQEKEINDISLILKINRLHIVPYIQKNLEYTNMLERKILTLEIKNNDILIQKLEKKIVFIKNIKVITHVLKNKNKKLLRKLIDTLKDKLKSLIIVLFNINNNSISVVIGVTKNLIQKIDAVYLISIINKEINGQGGGKPELAEGGSKNIKNINNVFKKINLWIYSKLYTMF